MISWILSGTVPGWTSLTLLLVMISSVQLLVLGLIGEYVGRTYIQSKNRPLFMISHIHRRPRLAGPLPHDPAFVRNDSKNQHSRCSPIWMPTRMSRFWTKYRDEGHPQPSCAVSGLSECRRLLRRAGQGDRGLSHASAWDARDRHRLRPRLRAAPSACRHRLYRFRHRSILYRSRPPIIRASRKISLPLFRRGRGPANSPARMSS